MVLTGDYQTTNLTPPRYIEIRLKTFRAVFKFSYWNSIQAVAVKLCNLLLNFCHGLSITYTPFTPTKQVLLNQV